MLLSKPSSAPDLLISRQLLPLHGACRGELQPPEASAARPLPLLPPTSAPAGHHSTGAGSPGGGGLQGASQ